VEEGLSYEFCFELRRISREKEARIQHKDLKLESQEPKKAVGVAVWSEVLQEHKLF